MQRSALPLVILVLTVSSFTAAAQVYEPTYEKVLIPLPTGDTAGAFGSIWRTALAVSNMSDTPVDVQGHGACRADGFPCRPHPIPPQGTIYITAIPVSDVPAAFLLVEPGRRDDVSITTRVFDRSRSHLTWGSSLPVVTRKELFTSRFGIGDVPVTDEFRSTLRIYDFDATTPAAVRVRIYKVTAEGSNEMGPAPTDPLLLELHPGFAVPVQGAGTDGHPGYTSIPLWLLPELAGAQRVRIVIEPLDATGDYWALVSSTHNETQHVTVIPPR
jgi:hypothetical protein